MKNKTTVTASIIAGVAICGMAGAVAMASTKKSKAKRITRKACKKLEMVGTMLQSMADMAK